MTACPKLRELRWHLRLGFVFSLVILLSMMALREMYSKGIKPMSYSARLRKPRGLKTDRGALLQSRAATSTLLTACLISRPNCWRWVSFGTSRFFSPPLATKPRTRWPPKSAGTTRRSRADRYRSIRSRTSSANPGGWWFFPILSLVVTGSLFGWASAPYDPLWERRHPRRAAWMALAGPATNYMLMLIAALILRLGWSYHWLRVDATSGRADFPTSVLGVFFFLNLLLGTFNLLPVPPLDGSTGIMLFMGESRAQRYLGLATGATATLWLGWWWRFFAFGYIFGPIERVVMDALLPEQLLFPLFRTIFRR